ncbi:MAG: IPT/TIG domain-containing protein, partial [Myxococcales bacterium]|nr:IPT/TIG domain-containing protein [Myxococcales bacterium]
EAGGNTLTITGSNFRAAGTWTMGGQPLGSVATITQNLVTAQAPAHPPGSVDVTYVGPDGQVAVLVDGYRYLAAPTLTSVVPGLGNVTGLTEVTLIGNNFTSGMKVYFGGVIGEVLSVGSATTATARTPAMSAGGFVDVLVRNPDGQEGLLRSGYEYLVAPTISSIWPPTGPTTGDTLVEIRGTGLHRQSAVDFGALHSGRVIYASSTLIYALTPPATAGPAVGVKVLNPDGQTTTLAGAFTYVDAGTLGAPPAITEFFPPAGPSSGGTRVGLDGSGFHKSGRAVLLAAPATVDYVRDDRAVVVAPAHPVGPAEVYWVNPDGQTARADRDFVYLDPSSVGAAPQVTSLQPDAGPTAGGQTVRVLGVRFQSGARVRFGPDDAGAVSASTTSIDGTTPPHARGTVAVWVVNPDGTQAQAATTYLYMAPPTIISVVPARGPASGGTLMTIEGSELLEDPDGLLPTVLFCDSYPALTGCVAADAGDVHVTANGRTLTAATPPHTPGRVDVAVVAPDGQAAYSVGAFDYSALPTITEIVPASGPTVGGATVTIRGVAYQTGVRALIGGKDCKDVVVLVGEGLRCTTPAGTTGTADVLVVNPDGGTALVSAGYTYLPPPIISSATPRVATEEDAAAGLVDITISGLNFSPSVRVLFDAAEADVQSATFNQIVATVPAGVGSVDLVVRNPDGQEARIVDGFAYIPPEPPPTALYITPRAGQTVGADNFRITGANFQDGVVVEFGQGDDWAAATGLRVDADGGAVDGLTPFHEAGQVDVRITNPDGQATVMPGAFEFVLPPEEQPLSIVNVDPARSILAGGAWVTVAGTGFRTGITLKFNQGSTTVPAPEIQRFGPTLMRARVPAAPVGAGPARLIVTNPATAGEPAETFEVDGFFEYLNGPVFERHPGDRLPNEDDTYGTDGALVFDANGDGLEDVLVYKNNGPDKLLVNGYSNRPGWFSRREFYVDSTSSHRTRFAKAVDLDADGDLDVLRIIYGSSSDRIDQCFNDGSGVFSCSQIVDYGNSCRMRRIEVADLNCDGREDIFVPIYSGNCYNQMLLNLGPGQWRNSNAPLPAIDEDTRDAAVADVDGDGDNDIMLVQDGSTTTRLLLNNCADLQLQHTSGCLLDIPDFAMSSYNGRPYARSNYQTNWDAARAHCQAFGYDLVTIEDADENDFVRFQEPNAGYHMWIGLRDTDGDNHDEWVPGTQNFPDKPYVTEVNEPGWFYQRYCDLPSGPYRPNTNPSQPNSTNDRCVYYWWDTSTCCNRERSCWDDVPCTSSYYFLCEGQGKAPCANTWQFVDVQYNVTFPLSGGDGYAALLFDINLDGLPDAVIGYADRTSRVFMNTGSVGTNGRLFLDDTITRWPAENPAASFRTARAVDLDGDGDLDIFAMVWNGHWEVRVYLNDRYVRSYVKEGCDTDTEDCTCNTHVDSCLEVVQEGVGVFTQATGDRWGPTGDPADIRTDASTLTDPIGVGDLDADGLPDIYISGSSYSDRMVMNDGFEEGQPWTDAYRVGIGSFRFNAYRALPEMQHGTDGVQFADVTGDHVPDILMCGQEQRLRLWVATGQGNYVDVTDQAFPNAWYYRCRANSIGVADIDEDGDNDVIFEGTDYNSCSSGVSCWGYLQLVNDGTGHFRDVTSPNFTSGHQSYGGEGVHFADVDDDGDMDWFVGYNYSNWGSRFYVNSGDAFNVGGAFGLNRTSEWLSQVSNANIVDVVIISVNGDRFPDFFVGTTGANRAWLNHDGQYFEDATSNTVPPGPFISASGTDTRDLVGDDFDNDGDIDIIDLINGRNRYFVRNGGDGFVDVTNDTMPTTSSNSIGGDSGDLDQDGYIDVVISNWQQQNELLLNLGGTGFQDLSGNLPFDRHQSRRPFLYDFDGDGDLDLYVPNRFDQHRIYVNTMVSP